MPADGKGAKGGDVMTKTHATGSAVSYGRRYLMGMIFNLAVISRDDDGNAASAGNVISEKQLADLRDFIDSIGANVTKVCQGWKIETLDQLPARELGNVMAALKDWAKNQKAGA